MSKSTNGKDSVMEAVSWQLGLSIAADILSIAIFIASNFGIESVPLVEYDRFNMKLFLTECRIFTFQSNITKQYCLPCHLSALSIRIPEAVFQLSTRDVSLVKEPLDSLVSDQPVHHI